MKEQQVIYVVEQILKYFPRQSFNIDMAINLLSKSEKIRACILNLRLLYIEDAPYIDLSVYNLTFTELKELIPKYNFISSIGNAMKQVLNGIYLEVNEPQIEVLKEKKNPLPSLIRCKNDSLWLYGRNNKSGESEVILLEDSQLSVITPGYLPNVENSNINLTGNDVFTIVKDLSDFNNGIIDVTLSPFAEPERIEILKLCLANCYWGNSTYYLTLGDFSLPLQVMSPILKHYTQMDMLGAYVKAEYEKIPYNERLSLAKQVAVSYENFCSIDSYQLDEHDRLEVLHLAIQCILMQRSTLSLMK